MNLREGLERNIYPTNWLDTHHGPVPDQLLSPNDEEDTGPALQGSQTLTGVPVTDMLWLEAVTN